MISVVIPALNEEKYICRCLDAIMEEGAANEIILADGGSTDRTLELAQKYPEVRIIKTAKGRGMQMNRGASAATGKVLLFLHADTRLEDGWSCEMLSALSDTAVAGGAFSFCVDNPQTRYRLAELWVRMRCALFNLPYGDQAVFIRKETFDRIGGYKNIPLMEDVDLVERMRMTGRLVMLDKKAVTSDRRWAGKGLLRASAFNQMIMVLYRSGVDPHTLARLYYR